MEGGLIFSSSLCSITCFFTIIDHVIRFYLLFFILLHTSLRVVASTLSDAYSCITAAIGILRGPLHGGANEAAMDLISRFTQEDEVNHFAKKCDLKRQNAGRPDRKHNVFSSFRNSLR